MDNLETPGWLIGNEQLLEEGISSGRMMSYMARDIEVGYQQLRAHLLITCRFDEWQKNRFSQESRVHCLEGKEQLVLDMATYGTPIIRMADICRCSTRSIELFLTSNGKHAKWSLERKKRNKHLQRRLKKRKLVHPEIDRLVMSDNPPSLGELATACTDRIATRQGVDYYLKSRGLINEYRKRRAEILSESKRRKIIGGIVWGTFIHALKNEDEEGYMARAVDSYNLISVSRKSADGVRTTAKVLKARDELQQAGEKINLKKIAKKAKADYPFVQGVFGRLGEKKDVSQGRVVLSKDKWACLWRALDLPMSDANKSYFARVPWYTFANIRSGQTAEGKKHLKGRWHCEKYRAISQIYDAVDMNTEAGE